MCFEEIEKADAFEDVAKSLDAAWTPKVRHACELLEALAMDNKFCPVIGDVVGAHVIALEVWAEDRDGGVSSG